MKRDALLHQLVIFLEYNSDNLYEAILLLISSMDLTTMHNFKILATELYSCSQEHIGISTHVTIAT